MVEVTDAMLAHQTGRLLGDQDAIALRPVLGMDPVVLASCHDSPPCGVFVCPECGLVLRTQKMS
ncbi:hypothetical protein GCM10009552_14180 [Rothia nasimurium]